MDTVRSVGTTMLTAGLMSGLMDVADLTSDPGLLTQAEDVTEVVNILSEELQRAALRSVVSAGVDTAINGGDLGQNLVNSLRTAAVITLGAQVAGEIGLATREGDLNYVANKIAHAALGAAMGEALSGDAAAGAIGAVVGEMTAEQFRDVLIEKIITGYVSPQDVEHWVQSGVDLSRLVAGLVAAAVGVDIDTAAETGGNAAENNAFFVTALILLASTIYSYAIGDGSVASGLAKIGAGEDPLSKAVASGVSEGVEFLAEQFPDATQNVLDMLVEFDGYLDAAITFVDDTTGNIVSGYWNDLDESTRNQILGGCTIVSLALSGDVVNKIVGLKGSVDKVKYVEAASDALDKTKVQKVVGLEDDAAEVISKAVNQLSKARFGHTFTTHGEDATDFLINRAKASGNAQGQFLNNQVAAKFIEENLAKTKNGAISVPMPKDFPARIINPDGTFGKPSTIRLVPGGKGVKSAYPEP
jgi:filamentous hemagglutinin